MTTTFRILTVVILLVIINSTNTFAEIAQPEHIRILFGYRFPPFYSVTKSKPRAAGLHGFFIDLLEDFKEEYPEYKLEYKCLPRARISKELKEGKADVFALSDPMFMQPEIKGKFIPSIALWKLTDHILVRRDSPITSNDLEKMLGKKIAVLHGNGYGQLDKYFQNGMIKRQAVYSTSQIIELVYQKRVDAAVCNKTTLPVLMKRAGRNMDEFRLIDSPLYTYTLRLVVSRKKTNFLRDFNSFVSKRGVPEIPAPTD